MARTDESRWWCFLHDRACVSSRSLQKSPWALRSWASERQVGSSNSSLYIDQGEKRCEGFQPKMVLLIEDEETTQQRK